MEAELVALAASGATTLVGLMVSESWTQAKERLGRFFSRGEEGESPSVYADLQLSREELLAAHEAGDEATAADVEAGWRLRLRRALMSDPAAAEELRHLLDELGHGTDQDPAGTVRNTISGGIQHGTIVQGRDFSRLTFHDSAGHRSEEE